MARGDDQLGANEKRKRPAQGTPISGDPAPSKSTASQAKDGQARNGKARGKKQSDINVGSALRSVYDQTVSENIPAEMIDLLGKLA
jgi:hypothetical protein